MTTTTSAGPAVDAPVRAGRLARPPFAGLGRLVRLVVRRDRMRISAWATGIIGLVVASAESITGLYDTQVELDKYAQLVRGNSALIVQAGPGYGLAKPTIGGVMMNELSLWTIIAVALMSVFMTVRHTRTEEESERAELIRAAPVGRHAQMAAALIGVALTNALIAAAVALALAAYGLPVAGSAAFGATLLFAGLLFASVAAVAAQVASSARSALALGGVVLAASFVLRAVGDVRGNAFTWLSPLGWGQAIRAYADERWWVLALPTVGTGVLVAASIALQARRDFGAGLLQQRPGRAAASRHLDSPLALAARLQRGSLVGWTVGMALVAFFYGIVADQAESIIEDNPDMADFFGELGQASITDAFLATSSLILALIASGFTIASVLRLRTEEASSRADPVLATPTARARWVWSHALVAGIGTLVLMVVTGASLGIGFALMTGDAGQIPRLTTAGVVMVPAMLVLGGVTLAICAWAPRAAIGAWSGLVAVFVIGMFKSVLDMPQWLIDVSPFEHVPALPAADFQLMPVLVLGLTVALVTAVGLTGYERRDIG